MQSIGSGSSKAQATADRERREYIKHLDDASDIVALCDNLCLHLCQLLGNRTHIRSYPL